MNVLQVGGAIAIVGIILGLCLALNNHIDRKIEERNRGGQ